MEMVRRIGTPGLVGIPPHVDSICKDADAPGIRRKVRTEEAKRCRGICKKRERIENVITLQGISRRVQVLQTNVWSMVLISKTLL
jgi:hypothetical protein